MLIQIGMTLKQDIGLFDMTDKHYYEKRRNTPRLPIVYTTPEILQKLDYLAEKYGSKKAAIEAAICALFNKEKAK